MLAIDFGDVRCQVSGRCDIGDVFTNFAVVGDNANIVSLKVVARSQSVIDGYVYQTIKSIYIKQ